jgi:hypothetical protein
MTLTKFILSMLSEPDGTVSSTRCMVWAYLLVRVTYLFISQKWDDLGVVEVGFMTAMYFTNKAGAAVKEFKNKDEGPLGLVVKKMATPEENEVMDKAIKERFKGG